MKLSNWYTSTWRDWITKASFIVLPSRKRTLYNRISHSLSFIREKKKDLRQRLT
jgi:hypothetical protein